MLLSNLKRNNGGEEKMVVSTWVFDITHAHIVKDLLQVITIFLGNMRQFVTGAV